MRAKSTVVHIRCPDETYERIRDHAYDLGRTVSREVIMWLQVGAAMSMYAAAIDPRASMSLPDPDELAELRRMALAELQAILARVLPTPVAPDVILASITPEMSVN